MKPFIALLLVWALPLKAFAKEGPTQAAQDCPKPDNQEPSVPNMDGMSYHEYVMGGLVGTVFGNGIGHAVQGRYADTGWKFTAGEVLSGVIIFASIAPCKDDFFSSDSISLNKRLSKCQKTGLVIGNVGFVALRFWEIIDVWVRPNPALRRELFGADSSSSPTRLSLAIEPHDGRNFGSLALSYGF